MLGGVRLNLFDTAGLRETGDVVEAEGIRRSREKLAQAGLVLAVFDGSSPALPADRELARACAGRRAVALINKNDLPQRFDEAVLQGGFSAVVRMAADRGGGLAQLEAAVARVLGVAGSILPPPCLVSQRQLSAAVEARRPGRRAGSAGRGLLADAVSVCGTTRWPRCAAFRARTQPPPWWRKCFQSSAWASKRLKKRVKRCRKS